MKSQRELRKALSWIFDAGDPVLTSALAQYSIEEIWHRASNGDFGTGVQRRSAAHDPEGLTALARRHGIRFVMPGDEEWPTQLNDLAHADLLNGRGGVPIGLWVRGAGHLAQWCERSIAVVGARACSAYGQECAADIAGGVAEHGWSVVSGGAYGIDIAAHRAAIAGPHGRTIAVMAGGPDVAYPRGNQVALQHLAQHHVVVSEIAPGGHPTRIRFLSRNRLIAALAVGSVMVEAGARSGARNTLAWSEALGRVCMAVPGSVYSALSVGPHHLLKDQRAQLVTGPDQVLELVSPMGRNVTSPIRAVANTLDQLSEELFAVYEVLPSRGYRTAGEVAMATGLAIPAVFAALAALEERGLAVPCDGGWRAAIVRSETRVG